MKLLGVEGEIIEIEKPVRLAILGCGSHVYRNILPAIRFIPRAVLTCVCDKNEDKSKLFARYHGIGAWYTSVEDLLEVFPEKFDALLAVVGFCPTTGRPLYPDIIPAFLEKGVPVWLEKPPASSADELQILVDSAVTGKTFFQTGFKMMFAPSIQKVKQLLEMPQFGATQSFDISYAVTYPDDMRNLTDVNARRFLDDIVHVLSQIQYLFGSPEKITTYKSQHHDATAILEYASGAVGSIRILGGISITGPAEYLRIVGTGKQKDNGHLIEVHHAEKIVMHEPGNPGSYGRDVSYIRADDTHSHVWNPDLRKPLGALSLHSHSLYGYINELAYFTDNVFSGRSSTIAGIEDSMSIMHMYDSFAVRTGSTHIVSEPTRQDAYTDRFVIIEEFTCKSCCGKMRVKDGWTANCQACGMTEQLIDLKSGYPNLDLYELLRDIVEHINRPAANPVAHVLYSNGLAKDKHQRVFIHLKLDQNSPDYEYFVKAVTNAADLGAQREHDALSIVGMSCPFVPKVHGTRNNHLVIQEFLPGKSLSSFIKAEIQESVAVLERSVTLLARFHNSHRTDDNAVKGYVHGDFDPWQVVVQNGDVKIIDWEDFNKDGNQIFDFLNFIFMVGVIAVGDTLSPSEKANKILYLDHELSKIIRGLIALYARETGIEKDTIIDLIPAYAQDRLERLRKMSRASDMFVYSHLFDIDVERLLWAGKQ